MTTAVFPDAVWTRQSAEWMVGPWKIAADDEHPDEVQVIITANMTAEFSDFPGQVYAVELNARGGMSINRWSLVFVHSTLRTMVWRRCWPHGRKLVPNQSGRRRGVLVLGRGCHSRGRHRRAAVSPWIVPRPIRRRTPWSPWTVSFERAAIGGSDAQ